MDHFLQAAQVLYGQSPTPTRLVTAGGEILYKNQAAIEQQLFIQEEAITANPLMQKIKMAANRISAETFYVKPGQEPKQTYRVSLHGLNKNLVVVSLVKIEPVELLKDMLSGDGTEYTAIDHAMDRLLQRMQFALSRSDALIKRSGAEDAEEVIQRLHGNYFQWCRLRHQSQIFCMIKEGLVPEPKNMLLQSYVDNIAKNICRELPRGREFRVTCNSKTAICALDEKKLTEVLLQLISNSYCYGATIVDLQVEVGQNQVCFAITDNGRGIPRQKMDHLYEEFYGLDLSGNGTALGLGLYMSKQLAKAMSAELQVGKREDGQSGTRAVLQLPFKQLSENTAYLQSPNTGAAARDYYRMMLSCMEEEN